MKKTLLSIGLFCLSFASNAQCTAVAALNETFETFTHNAPMPQNCWTASEAGPRLLSITANANTAIQLYVFTTPTVPFYLVSPELSTIDGQHKLSYSIGTPSAPGVLRIQVGTLSSPTDFTGFTPVGNPVVVNAASTQSDIIIPASTTQKHIAFRILSVGAPHIATTIDNIVYEPNLGISEENLNTFKVYPNPSVNKVVTISNENQFSENNNSVSIYNLTGAKVFETKLEESTKTLNLAELASGVYVLKINSGDTVTTKKLVLK